MAMPLDYSRPRLARPFREVAPIIDATNPIDAIGQIFGFMARNASYRVGVPDTSFFPFSAICRLNLTFPSGAYHGTGFYIGSGLILTCGHNLFDKTPSGSATEAATRITVRVGQQNATTWLDSFDLTPGDWTAHPTWVSSAATDRGFDLGVLRVTTPPPAGEFFQLINYSPSADTPIAVCGYGSDTGVDSQRQHLDIDRIRAISNNGENVDYNLQTRGGNSGSPVFAHFTKESAGGEMPETIPVMGVHVAGESTTLNRGVLLSPDKIDWALGGGISSVSAFSLSARPGSLGGLPLARRTRGSLGGLPLGPASGTPMLRTLSWARPLERAWIVIDQTGSGGMSVAKRTFGHPTHDLSGKTKVSVRVPNMPSGGSVRWNIPDDDHKTRAIFETGGNATAHSTGGTSVTLRSTAAGPFAVDCMVKDSGGSTVESNKYWMSSPQFVLVAIHPTTDAFFDGIGMRTRRAAIVDEMKAVMRHLYRNVNIRFVFPGEALPAHLGVANNAAFPGGIEALPSVQYAEVIGADTVMDPEETQATGTPTPYGATSHGRNHEPGDLPAPMDHHALARGLIHHFADTRAEIGHVQTEAAAGRLSAGDMDLAARMYGRLMGENLSHEVGHFLANTFVAHTGGGLMQTGRDRTTRERTGMTVQAAAPVITDHGRNTINELPADVLHTFEEFLPIDPPIDQATFTARGRVGTFSRAQGRQGGWVNRVPARPFEDETIHLPGATVLSGWEAQAFIFAIEAAFRSLLSANPAFVFVAPFVRVGTILDACDRYGVTLAVGIAGSGALGAGAGAGGGVVFAPGRRIGFYGSGAGIVGSVYSIGGTIQITLIDGGPEFMSGTGYMLGVSIGTIGWFDAGAVDVPVAAYRVYDGAKNPIGYSFEIGVSAGLPIISLIEAYGQVSETATTFAHGRARGRAFSAAAAAPSEAYEAAVNEAMAAGASREEAEAFLSQLFG
ncbi:MAG TPA: trypsin-like peptidase domain-containing protein [Amaricoccus sp.]|nr:trypsin-like peptidase domain-containing protein [Amaricoccus sp.]